MHRFRPDREIWAQDLASVREHGFQLGRDGSLVRARVAGGREIPPQHRGCEGAKVRQQGPRLRGAPACIASPLLHAPAEKLLAFGIAPIQQRPRLDERRGGDNQPGRADETDPFQVGGDLGVESGHRLCGGEYRPACGEFPRHQPSPPAPLPGGEGRTPADPLVPGPA